MVYAIPSRKMFYSQNYKRKRNIINTTYEIHGEQLKLFDKSKYLGVTISKNLSWKNYIDLITSKATTTRIFRQRNLPMTDKETRLKCYKTFIRPIVEYASSVWDPVENQSLTHQIETGNSFDGYAMNGELKLAQTN